MQSAQWVCRKKQAAWPPLSAACAECNHEWLDHCIGKHAVKMIFGIMDCAGNHVQIHFFVRLASIKLIARITSSILLITQLPPCRRHLWTVSRFPKRRVFHNSIIKTNGVVLRNLAHFPVNHTRQLFPDELRHSILWSHTTFFFVTQKSVITNSTVCNFTVPNSTSRSRETAL